MPGMVVGAGNAIIDEDTVAALKVPTRKGEKPRAPVEAPGCFMAATHPGGCVCPTSYQAISSMDWLHSLVL